MTVNTLRFVLPAQSSKTDSTSSSIVRSWPGPSVQTHFVPLNGPLDERLSVARNRASPQTRAYRALRHRLFSLGDPRVIVVASGAPGEGRTTCAANLAIVLSEEAGTHVLLAEANTASPGLSRLLRVEKPADLGQRLDSPRGAEEPWPVNTFDGTFAFHAALISPDRTGAHLDRPIFSEFIAAMRREYDYIVLDTPPLNTSADAEVAAQVADGVVLVARSGSTRQRSLERAMERFSPVPMMGVVLLDATKKDVT